MLFYKPIQLKTAEMIRIAALKQMADEWDFYSEKLLRLPLEGTLFTEVNAELNSLGIPSIAIWSIFARPRSHAQSIHCDAASETQRVNSGIVIPVLGTKGSLMQWFSEENMVMKNVINPDGKSSLFRRVSAEEPKVISEVEVTEPLIVRINVPHRAVASLTRPRAVVSIKFRGNPELLDN